MAKPGDEDELTEFADGDGDSDAAYYVAADLDEIIKALEPVAGFDLDRFTRKLEYRAWWYQSLSQEDISRAPSTLSRAWGSLARQVGRLDESFERLTGRERVELEAAARVRDGVADQYHTLGGLSRLRGDLEEAARRAAGAVSTSGNRPQAPKNEFFLSLIEIYCEARAVESAPRPSYDETLKGEEKWRHEGVLAFIESCGKPLGINDTYLAIFKRLEKIYFS